MRQDLGECQAGRLGRIGDGSDEADRLVLLVGQVFADQEAALGAGDHGIGHRAAGIQRDPVAVASFGLLTTDCHGMSPIIVGVVPESSEENPCRKTFVSESLARIPGVDVTVSSKLALGRSVAIDSLNVGH